MVTVWHATLNMSRQGHHHIFFLVNTHKLGHRHTSLFFYGGDNSVDASES